jgi:cytochrome o ubiquinol oxidase subunit II
MPNDDLGNITMRAKSCGLLESWRAPRHLRSAIGTACRIVIAAPIVLTACQPAILNPDGAVGIAEKTLMIDSLIIMLAIVIPTIAATFAFAWWFRTSNTKAKYLPGFTYSGRLELIVWAIPILVIMLLGGVIWIGSHDLDPAKPLASKTPPLDIQVVSLDWKWLFIYPNQGVASVNQLVLPAGVPIRFYLTSASVMNAFFIPQLGSMIYTMNGMTTHLNLQADAPGTFHGLSSHFSGDGFPGMHFDVQALPAEQFAAWIETARATGPTLDAAGYTTLSRQSLNVAPFTYRATTPGLFQQIATQVLPPGPGPQTGRPNQNVSPRTE